MGNLIAAVGVTGLCVIEMKRRATPLERNYYYHLCVHEYVVCSCHNQPSEVAAGAGAKARPGRASHQGPSGIAIVFPLCAARLGLVLFFLPFVFLLFLSLCCMQLGVRVCVSAGCTHFHMNAPDLPHSPEKVAGKGWEVLCANETGRGKQQHEMTKTAESR